MKRLAILFLAITTAAFAQQPYIETFEVRLHNLDVVVTDAKGNPVRGLSKEDFVVVDDGARQPITNFSIYDSRVTHDASDTRAAEAPVVQPPPRKFVFFIDELMAQKMARTRLIEHAHSLVDAMDGGDVAAVVRPAAQNKIALEFTSDKAAIRAAVRKAIEESSGAMGPRQEIAALRRALLGAGTPVMRRAARYEYADAAKRRVEHRLGQLRAVTSSLAGIEGKKVLVLVSQALTARPGSEAWNHDAAMGSLAPLPAGAPASAASDPSRIERPVIADLTKTIEDIGRTAAANGVTIYAIEPDVRADLSPRDNPAIPMEEGTGMPNPGMDIPRTFEIDILQNAAVTMESLAESTGGRWYRGIGDIDDVFRQVSDDVSFYYSLAYRATGSADKPREVAVSIRNRPELRVRTRGEVIEKSTAREMNDLVVASLLYPRSVNELGINVTSGTPAKARGLYTVPIDIVIPLKNLTFFPTENGRFIASFDLYFAAAGEQRDFGSGGEQQQKIEISKEQHARLPEMTYRYKTSVQVSQGHARIAIGLIDPLTKLTGFRTVEVLAQ